MIESLMVGGLKVPPEPVSNALICCFMDRPDALLPYLRRARGDSRELLAHVAGEQRPHVLEPRGGPVLHRNGGNKKAGLGRGPRLDNAHHIMLRNVLQRLQRDDHVCTAQRRQRAGGGIMDYGKIGMLAVARPRRCDKGIADLDAGVVDAEAAVQHGEQLGVGTADVDHGDRAIAVCAGNLLEQREDGPVPPGVQPGHECVEALVLLVLGFNLVAHVPAFSCG